MIHYIVFHEHLDGYRISTGETVHSMHTSLEKAIESYHKANLSLEKANETYSKALRGIGGLDVSVDNYYEEEDRLETLRKATREFNRFYIMKYEINSDGKVIRDCMVDGITGGEVF